MTLIRGSQQRLVPGKPPIVLIALADIVVSDPIVPSKLQAVVQAMRQRAPLDPVALVQSKATGQFHVYDGNHRITAARLLGVARIAAIIVGDEA